ncbi:MAG TPA: hypothetical protein VJ892_00895, partial [Candidatus Absconditabacterales bacterium]|nr:hypothetical protein [Candidatus Absconditabacterales bacterium]
KYEYNGVLHEYTYDENGNILTYQNSNGFSYDCTLDENSNEIAFKNSNGFYQVKGNKVTKEEYEAFIAQLNSNNLDGKEAEIEGRKYKLTLIK